MDASERLARVQHLLAGLPGPYGNAHLWTLIGFAGGEDLFTGVFAFLADCGVIDSARSFGGPPQAPQDAEELAVCLAQVDQDGALAVLVGMVSRTLAYGVRGRYPVDKAQDVFEKLITLLGYGTRWWTNTDLGSWNPATTHAMDALVAGTGGGILVAVLAVDED
ncbi:hypothetical protein OG994_03995 [Micromonospora globbae]|uniref:Uncharacterized protein n=1 Tax=Micromonospora globbae TaxID=1894969 RepID=A0ABZ1S9M3_9ACTN|nr:hypothetical protein [Micromonospora globbae]